MGMRDGGWYLCVNVVHASEPGLKTLLAASGRSRTWSNPKKAGSELDRPWQVWESDLPALESLVDGRTKLALFALLPCFRDLLDYPVFEAATLTVECGDPDRRSFLKKGKARMQTEDSPVA